jgi:CHAT domain-containing protein
MIAFYRDLAAGRSREEAINRAAAGQRARRNHPYFWAPFILIGRTTPFDSGGTSSAPACRR